MNNHVHLYIRFTAGTCGYATDYHDLKNVYICGSLCYVGLGYLFIYINKFLLEVEILLKKWDWKQFAFKYVEKNPKTYIKTLWDIIIPNFFISWVLEKYNHRKRIFIYILSKQKSLEKSSQKWWKLWVYSTHRIKIESTENSFQINTAI